MIKFEGLIIKIEPEEAIKRFRTVKVQKLADGIWHVFAELEWKEEHSWFEVVEGVDVGELMWRELMLMKCNGDCKHIASLKFRRDWSKVDDGITLFWFSGKYGMEIVAVSDKLIGEGYPVIIDGEAVKRE